MRLDEVSSKTLCIYSHPTSLLKKDLPARFFVPWETLRVYQVPQTRLASHLGSGAKHWEDSKLQALAIQRQCLSVTFCRPTGKEPPPGHSCHIASTGSGANRFDRLNECLVFWAFKNILSQHFWSQKMSFSFSNWKVFVYVEPFQVPRCTRPTPPSFRNSNDAV